MVWRCRGQLTACPQDGAWGFNPLPTHDTSPPSSFKAPHCTDLEHLLDSSSSALPFCCRPLWVRRERGLRTLSQSGEVSAVRRAPVPPSKPAVCELLDDERSIVAGACWTKFTQESSERSSLVGHIIKARRRLRMKHLEARLAIWIRAAGMT